MEWRVKTPEEMTNVAAAIVRECVPDTQATVLALSGDLGAGKTTLVQALATQIGVSEVVTSPTFVIQKQYEAAAPWNQLVHIDAYRLESQAELTQLGFAELLTLPNTIICIEWPERVASILPKSSHHLTITMENTDRIIKLLPYAQKD